MKEIKLTRDRVALVDDEDFDWLNQYKWQAINPGSTWYAKRTVVLTEGRKDIYMHRLILDAPVGVLVDHINFNGLDNQKSNIRLCTKAENQRHVIGGWGTSAYRGVAWCTGKQRWRAVINLNGKPIFLGYYKSEYAAALAYNQAAIEYHGEFASQNKMEDFECQSTK